MEPHDEGTLDGIGVVADHTKKPHSDVKVSVGSTNKAPLRLVDIIDAPMTKACVLCVCCCCVWSIVCVCSCCHETATITDEFTTMPSSLTDDAEEMPRSSLAAPAKLKALSVRPCAYIRWSNV